MGPSNDRHGLYFEDMSVGLTGTYSKTVSDADIVLFASITGDTNPLHLDEEFAAASRFKGRIAHGMLTASLISTVLGTKMPGPGAVYLKQSLEFIAPVRIGDTVRARATVAALDASKNFVDVKTSCTVSEREVLRGSALIFVASR